MFPWKNLKTIGLVTGLGLAMLAGGTARGETRFDLEIQAIADDIAVKIKNYVAKYPGLTVHVGTFESVSERLPARGTAITLALREGLRKQGLTVADRVGKIRITGTFEPGTDADTREPATKISYTVMDHSVPGKVEKIVDGQQLLVDMESTIKINGPSAKVPPGGSERERQEAVNKQIDKPSAFADKARVRSQADSEYAMEIWVDGKPRDVVMKDKIAYVALKPGEQIAVLLVNGSRREAAVSLSIDGINSFSFQERSPGSRTAPINEWTVQAGKSGYIQGWYINPKKWELFKMTEDPKEIAALTISDDPADVGTITAVFKASWAVGEAPPADEPKVQAPGRAKGIDLGVGRGAAAAIEAPPRDTVFGVIRDSITIRYQKIGVTAPAQVAEGVAARP